MSRMSVDSRSAWQWEREAPGDAWLDEYSRYEADREFRRARWRSIARLFRRAVRGGAGLSAARSFPAAQPSADGLMISVDSVVGAIDSSGRIVSRLLPLPRRLADPWRRAFTRDDAVEALPVLDVRPGPGGWYIDAASLLALEIARAKGYRQLRVRPAAWPMMPAAREPEDQCVECGCEPELPRVAG